MPLTQIILYEKYKINLYKLPNCQQNFGLFISLCLMPRLDIEIQ